MTVSKDHAQMLTTLAVACRPAGARRWDSAGVMAALAKVADRGLAEVVMATVRAASDRNVDSPGVIPSAGSHWAESASVRTFVPDSAPVGTRCTICGRTEDNHAAVSAGPFGHPFYGVRPVDPNAYAERIAELRTELAPTAGPTERRTLDDLADANPALHANLERLRAANPGLRGPQMRESGPDESEAP
jgi:hypothetical protein